jgi:hypothetical protein
MSPQGSFIAHHRKQEGRWMISKAALQKKRTNRCLTYPN